MAELMRKFFEMNDTDVLIVAVLYFGSVLIGGIYCIRKSIKEEKKGVKSEDKSRRKKRNTMDRR